MDFLHILWYAIPGIFFLVGLYSFLEKVSGDPRKQDPAIFFKQGFFVLLIVLLCVWLDKKYTVSTIAPLLPSGVPILLPRALLLPVLLVIGAKLVGGTKPPSLKDAKIGKKKSYKKGKGKKK